MIGKPEPVATEVWGIESALAALHQRMGALHEQITYLQEHTAFISLPTNCFESGDEGKPVTQPIKSPLRATIDEIVTSVEIATSRVMHVRCNLDT